LLLVRASLRIFELGPFPTSNCFLQTTVDPVTSTIEYHLHLHLSSSSSSLVFRLHLHRSSFLLIIFIARLHLQRSSSSVAHLPLSLVFITSSCVPFKFSLSLPSLLFTAASSSSSWEDALLTRKTRCLFCWQPSRVTQGRRVVYNRIASPKHCLYSYSTLPHPQLLV
jgi:hypothetical protein